MPHVSGTIELETRSVFKQMGPVRAGKDKL